MFRMLCHRYLTSLDGSSGLKNIVKLRSIPFYIPSLPFSDIWISSILFFVEMLFDSYMPSLDFRS